MGWWVWLTLCLLTPRCRVLLEQLTCLQLVKKFAAFHGTRRFIIAITSVRHLSLSWASPIQSIYPHPTSWRSILILSTHLHLGLPWWSLSLRFPHQDPIHTPSPYPYAPHAQPISFSMGLTTHQNLGSRIRISAAVLPFPLRDFVEFEWILPERPFGYKNHSYCPHQHITRYIALIPSIFAGHRALINVKFTLKPEIKTEGAKVQLNSFFNLGARWVWVVNATPRPLYPRGKTRYPSCRRLDGHQGWSGLGGLKFFAYTGVGSPDRPARGQSYTPTKPSRLTEP